MNKKGFTLVELLAVIVILAVILVISVPKITDVIDNTKKSAMESTLKMIATTGEKEYTAREILGRLDQENNPIECSDIVNLSNDDYDTCNITFNNGIASVTLVGKGKFAGYTLIGTKDSIARIIGNDVYSEPILNGAYPRLDAGMIPVTISNNGKVTSVHPSTTWYSYEDKLWANAVLVKTEGVHTREYYKTHYGVINKEDILAYFVWIPRYKYKLFNVEGNAATYTEEGECTANCPQTIEIVFENKDIIKSTGTTNGTYLTHPAFTYDGVELNGIWVGKFETTGTNNEPTILPDAISLVSQDVSTHFETSLKFRNNYYGLSSESRMMKNNEWGAVAYLSHSIYGVNSEIFANNSSGVYTGRSAGEVGDGECGTATIVKPGGGMFGGGGSIVIPDPEPEPYNTNGTYSYEGYTMSDNTKTTTQSLNKIASTTGNITGIYDMSGGSLEYIMGVLAGDDGNGRSGFNIDANSGYNGQVKDATYITDKKTFPNSKYYKIYKRDKDNDEIEDWYNNPDYLGEALGETRGWYNDTNYILSIYAPWFARGEYYDNCRGVGAFHFNGFNGVASQDIAFRSIVISS